jgi:hypothetical protein
MTAYLSLHRKTPSGLPAISPTRGERTRGALLALMEARQSGRSSPSPLWGGVGEGTLLEIIQPAAAQGGRP